jgi:tetratricopeptide (TPR) repeat protein
MSLLQRNVLTLVLLGATVGTLEAQIPLRQNGANPAANAPRLLVATPYTDRAADSATAVAIGAALRTRFQRAAGTTYFVIPRDQMNRALGEYSYPADALLNRESARRLATAMQSRIMLFSELGREGGRLRMRARFAGLSDDAGNTITLVQQAGQSNQQFGEAVAVAFTQAIRAQKDAKDCVDLVATNATRAEAAAVRALRLWPSHGLAHFCLADVAKSRSAENPAYQIQLDSAVRGDSLSLRALGALADLYSARNDTANVILKWQQMIEADPTNRALIENASKIFRSLGRPDAAEQVADRGIALDSLDIPMWDLRSSACVFQSKYSCAVQSLEQIVVIDSARADTLLVFRLQVTAGMAAADSTPLKDKWLQWSRFGLRHYPNNANILSQALQAYSAFGMTDSVLVLTDRVLQINSADMSPALSAIEILLTNKRWADAARYGQMVLQTGDDQQKLAIAANFTNHSRTLLTTQPTDPEAAYGLLKVGIPAAAGDQRIAPLANFLMGFAGLQTAAKFDAQAQAERSCEIARKMDGMLDEALAGFTTGRSVNAATVDQQLPNVRTYKTRTQSMIQAYCR